MTTKKAAPDMSDAEFVEWAAALPDDTLLCQQDRQRIYILAGALIRAASGWRTLVGKQILLTKARAQFVDEVIKKLA